MKLKFSQRGQTLIEVLFALAISSLVLPALLTGILASREGKAQQMQRLQATSLLREASEAVRSVRELGWSVFAVDGLYHPEISGGNWFLAAGQETVGGFSRSVQVAPAYRDPDGNIVVSGGTLDPSTKKVLIRVAWQTPSASEVNSTLFVTRYLDNDVQSQTSEADFNAGTNSNTVVSGSGGGAVVLASGILADWCAPNLQINPVDLPKNGVANAISAIEGKVFAGTGDNASGVSYATVGISNTKPPVSNIVNTFNGFKTNTIFGENNYAYLGTDTNNKEVVIIDITGANPFEVGRFNAPGPGSGDSIFVSGNIGFVVDQNILYSFDLSSKTDNRPQLGSVNLAANGRRVVVNGGYAFVAVDSNTTQLQIIDVSNPASMSVVGQAAVAGQGGRDVYVRADGNRAYLATAGSGSNPEFFVIDTSAKTGNRPTLGTYDTNGMNPRAVTVVPGSKAIIVGSGNTEYQVINISNENSPGSCGGLEIDTGVNGVASVLEADGDAFSYIITGDASTELKLIEGFGGGVTATGTFESSTFDAGATAAFNRFFTDTLEPAGTSIKYQVAVAPAVAGNCTGASFSYIGPDGTDASFFTGNSNPIPALSTDGYQNPGQCFRYKVFLSSNDPSITPFFFDININYSP